MNAALSLRGALVYSAVSYKYRVHPVLPSAAEKRAFY